MHRSETITEIAGALAAFGAEATNPPQTGPPRSRPRPAAPTPTATQTSPTCSRTCARRSPPTGSP